MKKTAKALIIIILITIVMVGGLLIYRRLKNKNNDGGSSSSSTGSSSNSTGGSNSSNDNFPLTKGSRGEKVKFIQKYINKLAGIDLLTVDGIWGNATEKMAKRELTRAYADGQITLAEWNRLVRIWNFCANNGLSLSQFEQQYVYNDATGTIEKKNNLNSGSANNSGYNLGESYVGIGII